MTKINKRLAGRSNHIGGAVAANSLDPIALTDEAISEKRKAREEAEDMEGFMRY